MSADLDALLPLARAVARRYHADGHDLDDLTQEAWLAMAEAPPDAPPAALYWRARKRLRRIALRAARQRCQPLPLQVAGADAVEPGGLAELVRRSLPRQEAEVMAAIFWGDETPAQVAKRLGVTPCRVHQIKAAAIARLRAAMGQPASP